MMVIYRLKCAEGHEFDAWFRDSQTYEVQVAQEEISCPYCDSIEIGKAIMAPSLAAVDPEHDKTSISGFDTVIAEIIASEPNEETVIMQKLLRAIHGQVHKLCDDVGHNFAEEARKIHYKEAEPRNIFGDLTLEEARELHDEGVEFYYIPTVPVLN
jgi:hypothetical protein